MKRLFNNYLKYLSYQISININYIYSQALIKYNITFVLLFILKINTNIFKEIEKYLKYRFF